MKNISDELKWSISQGPSKSVLFSREVSFHRLEIRPIAADFTGLKQLWKRVPDCTEHWIRIMRHFSDVPGATMTLAMVIPEAVSFPPDDYERALQILDDESAKSHRVFMKCTHPTNKMSAFGVEYPVCLFVLDIGDDRFLRDLVAEFRTFDSLRLLVLNLDADAIEISSQLQALFLERSFLLDDLVEQISLVISLDYFGERLYIESTSEQVLLSSSQDFKVVPVPDQVSKQEPRRSIWWGRRKLFQWGKQTQG